MRSARGRQPRGVVCGLAVMLVTAGLAVACSADPACVLGSPGWCENEMAALALRAVVGDQADQVQADEVAVVTEGFVLEERRYGALKVLPVKPDEVERVIASRAQDTMRVLVVVRNVQIVNASGPGNVMAQGAALVHVYRGGARMSSEEVRGKLVGGTWLLVERKRVEAGNSPSQR